MCMRKARRQFPSLRRRREMAILTVSLTLPSKPTLSYHRLSSFSSTADNLSLSLSSLSLHRPCNPQTSKLFTVRMGGGPRTYPGGVSKWQWKRMQKKKATQLLKARLMRERQIYEMRKRAELKAAVSELERPWEVVEQAAPNLFSVSADEQLKVLADRFQKPGGFDLWSEKDGPQLFETPNCLPTSRFFPKGVVHSIKPYSRVNSDDDEGEIENEIDDMRTQIGRGLKQGSRLRLSGSSMSMKQGRPDRNPTGRITDAENSDDNSSQSSSSRVFSGANRLQSGKRNLDRNLSVRFSDAEDSHRESLNSSKSRVSSGVNRGQRSLDKKGTGNRRDGNLSVRPNDTGYSHGKSSYSSNSMDFHAVNRSQSDQRNLDKKESGSKGDSRFRRMENRRNVRSSGGTQRVKLPELRRSSSTREQRNISSQQIDGSNRSRSDPRLQKRMSSSYPEDVFDLSLQTDGSYSLGSS